MKRLVVLAMLGLMFGGCSKDGSNGSDGSSCSVDKIGNVSCTDGTKYTIPSGEDGKDGSNGSNGKDGVDGIAGVDGVDGTDNKIYKKIYCSGFVTSGTWTNLKVTWEAVVLTSGDVFSTARMENLGSFNVSGSSFYSSTQVGAASGYVQMQLDSYDTAHVEYNPETDGILVEITGSHPMTATDSSPEVCESYLF